MKEKVKQQLIDKLKELATHSDGCPYISMRVEIII